VKGGYSYDEIPKGATQPDQAPWDNSNSQYGALGVWAADDAGAGVPAFILDRRSIPLGAHAIQERRVGLLHRRRRRRLAFH